MEDFMEEVGQATLPIFMLEDAAFPWNPRRGDSGGHPLPL